MHWTDIFNDFLHIKIGVGRATVLTMRPASVHKDDLHHGEAFDLIKDEFIAQASHTYSIYHKDNAAVYYCLQKAVRDTQYALTLKQYQQAKNGRGALASITQRFARADKWQAELSMRRYTPLRDSLDSTEVHSL
eukprot:13176130-Ditylum_brightwellii.AAC.1